jgi:N-6 DNA Methylase
MCLEYNRHFEHMKAGMADIDDSNPAKLYAFIEEHLTPKTVEKKTNGEVFTPLPLVREMLGAIETYADKAFWTNPDLKILDPAAGIGNFPLIAFEKLMEGLKKRIPSAAKRKRHILEKMLYMVELNGNNTRMVRRIFNGKEYKLNIVKGDFLSPKTHKKLAELMGDEEPKFDLVMGNPPFQADQKAEGKRGGGEQIWDDFVKIGLTFLKGGATMVFVHPSGWRKPESDQSKYKGMFEMMTRDCQMCYLEIHDTDDGKRTFNCSTRYDWYVIENRKASRACVVKDEQEKLTKLQLHHLPWLPNFNFESVFKLVAEPNEKTCDVLYSRTAYGTDKPWVKSDEWVMNNGHPKAYKKVLIHSTPQSGTRFAWTNDTTKDVQYGVPMFGVPKVIFGEGGINQPISNADGKYAMTQEAIAVVCKKSELKKLSAYLQSAEFSKILEACRWSNFRIDWRLIASFKDRFWEIQI